MNMALTPEHKERLRESARNYWQDPQRRAEAREYALAGAKKRQGIKAERDALRVQVQDLESRLAEAHETIRRMGGGR